MLRAFWVRENADMAKFRKKPVVIEAVQWWGDNVREVSAWIGSDGLPAGWVVKSVAGHVGVLVVPTLEGFHMAMPGDWIIRGVKGEYYPCKPEIFEMTYESVDEGGE